MDAKWYLFLMTMAAAVLSVFGIRIYNKGKDDATHEFEQEGSHRAKVIRDAADEAPPLTEEQKEELFRD